MVGQVVSHYRIEGLLGEGGMGIVYKARDLSLDRWVAVKFLQSNRASDEKELRRFIQEAKAASSLDHPNICTIHEISNTADGQVFIVMAYYEGETLRRKLAGGPLSMEKSISHTIDIAQGLGKAHSRGLVHRDIKPENIMITDDGIAKILDFGLVKLNAESAMTMSEGLRGTIAYMAPEQLRGQSDQRTDLWALGVVLYEMITGRRPFSATDPFEMMRLISDRGYPSARVARENLPPEVEEVITRALSKSPEQRYQRAEEMLAHLHAARHGIQFGTTVVIPDKPRRGSSIAVLPFLNMNHDQETEYFGDGLADELIHLLSQVRGLLVVSHTSAFEFKGKTSNIQEIGARLNVKYILEGSVRRAGNRLRITVQLTDASAGYHLWSERYDRELKDIFEIQEEIALSIVSLLRVKLEDEVAPKSRYEGDVEAHEHYMRGRYYLQWKTEEGFRRAGEAFQQAIAVDPACAPAYAGLADYYFSLGFWGVMPPTDAWSRGRELAAQAVKIDHRLADAEIILAKCVLFMDWDWQQAEERFLRAIELDPALSTGHFGYSVLLIQAGRFESALLELKAARRLDPLSLTIITGLAWAYLYLGKYDRAAEECQQALDMNSNYIEPQVCMGLIALREGRFTDAITWFERVLAVSGGTPLGLGLLGYGYALNGRQAEATQILQQLTKGAERRYVSPVAHALVHIGLGNQDEALDWLEKAYGARDALLAYANVFPPYDTLRGSPRFQALLKRMAFATKSGWKPYSPPSETP